MARKNILVIFFSIFFQMGAGAEEKIDSNYLNTIPIDSATLTDYEGNPQKYLQDERLLRHFAVEFAKFMYVTFSKQLMTSMNLSEGPVPKAYLDVVINYLKSQPKDDVYLQVKNSEVRYRLLTSNYRMAAVLNLTKQGFFKKYVPEMNIDTKLIENYLANPYRYWQRENISVSRRYFLEVYNFYYANQVISTMRRFSLSKNPVSTEFYEGLKTQVGFLTDDEIFQAVTANNNALIYFDSQIKNELIARLLEILFDKLNITQSLPSTGEPQVLEEVRPSVFTQFKNPLVIFGGIMLALTWLGMFLIYFRDGRYRPE